MRRFSSLLMGLSLLMSGFFITQSTTAYAAQPKDWTFLVFLNGNNNLDSFGTMNLRQMEKIGSTDNVNIVVQWASMKTKKVERLLIKKGSQGTGVNSPVVQTLKADMGDWHSVVDFVKWGAQNYPADHYFLDIWDHGSGWHDKVGHAGKITDISWDELTGNHITTKQLGLALTESAKAIGHKIDLYASDACLMAMVEIANEVADSVSVFGGSQETEPGAGWPYDTFLQRLTKNPKSSPQEVGKMLSEEYAKSYQTGSEHVTFSIFDLANLPALNKAISKFGQSMNAMSAETSKAVLEVASNSQNFTNSDYVDLIDFLNRLKSSSITSLDVNSVKALTDAAKNFIVTTNNVGFPNANGVSIWIPTESYEYSQYASLYSQMKFDSETHWGDFLKQLIK